MPSLSLDKISHHSGLLALIQPRFGSLLLLNFPKLKSSLKGMRLQTVAEIKKNATGQLKAIPKVKFVDCFEKWKSTGIIESGFKRSTLKKTNAPLSYKLFF